MRPNRANTISVKCHGPRTRLTTASIVVTPPMDRRGSTFLTAAPTAAVALRGSPVVRTVKCWTSIVDCRIGT